MPELKGMTWNHPRGLDPLVAASRAFQNEHPDVTIKWEARSLKDFEDFPVEVLAAKYDLVMIDHPFTGTAVQKQLFIPLDQFLPDDFLKDQAANSVGGSYASYTLGGHQYALAVDAAAQVTAYRADLLAQSHHFLPRSWAEVFEFAASLPDGVKLGLPLNQTHAYSSFLSLCANAAGLDFWHEDSGIDPVAAARALNLLQTLLPLLHPASLDSDPIQIYEIMSTTSEIGYVPLIFGYSNYGRPGFRPHLVSFGNIPGFDPIPAGSLLGGVGLAISARSQQQAAALAFAKFVAGESCQRKLFIESGGQPGYRAAWTDLEVNRQSNAFFSNTLQTLDLSYTRPRFPGYAHFQEQAGEKLHQFLLGQEPQHPAEFIQKLNGLYFEVKAAGTREEANNDHL